MRLIHRVVDHPLLQIMQRPAFYLAHQQRPQIGLKRQLLGLGVIAALLSNRLAPPRWHCLVKRLPQRAGADEGSQWSGHLAPLGRLVHLRTFGRTEELCADRGYWLWHPPPLSQSCALL